MRNVSLLILAIIAGVGSMSVAAADAGPAPGLTALHFRFIGPNGNRDISVVGVPGDPNVAYFGAASGGIWKTTDGGTHFESIFDSTDVSSVGALALAPSNPDIVWAGTGEPYIIREATSVGDGVYKSTDAGKTWEHMGLEKTGHISNIAINPGNPDIVFVCAIGQVYKPNPERGVYRTEDGGKTWKLVLKVNETTGCSGLSMDVHNPDTLFASTWQVTIRPWDLDSGGPGGGVFVTHDGGNTWSRLGANNGLPAQGTLIGKTAVRIAPSNDKIVYALMQGPKTGLLYRSDNGGANWTLVHEGDELDMRAPYYTNFTIAPDNPDVLYIPSTPFLVSRDGGHTVRIADRRPDPQHPDEFYYPGGDTHDVWVDPKDTSRILTANDQGGFISLTHGRQWYTVNLPIAQIYHVDTDTSIPYNVAGNRQDTSSVYGPSRVLTTSIGSTANIPPNAWHGYDGCESGFGVFDPVDPDVIWSGCYNGDLVRVNLKTGQAHNVSVWPIANFGAAPSEVRDRWNWSFPIAISPFDHNEVYVGSQYIYATTDAGHSWKRISPDLTTGKHLGNSGGLTVDNLMTFSSATLSIIDESPVKRGVIWAGSYDGQVSITRDGGVHWINVTANIKGLPPYGTINLEASPFDAGTAYVTSNDKMMGDYNPYIFETADYGKTWKNISGDLPHSEFSYVHVVRTDPVRKGMLYAGTENSLYVSWDDGMHWTQLKGNFPPAPVYWLKIQPKFSDLAIATYGRGIWILDDVTALRSWDRVSQEGMPHLFAPRAAYRFRSMVTGGQGYPNGFSNPNEPTQGVSENIPYGADLNYYLPHAATVEIIIADGSGETVRVLNEKGTAGLNRVFWDLRYKDLLKGTLLTNPPGKPWVDTPAKGRPLTAWGQPGSAGPLVVPGIFRVALKVDGTEVGSQSLQVLPDPHSVGTQSTMVASRDLQLQIAQEIDQTVGLINRLEVTRKSLEDLDHDMQGKSGMQPMSAAARALGSKAAAIEGRLFAMENSGSTEDSFARAPRLYAKFGSLYKNLNAEGSDVQPTTQQLQANSELRATLESVTQTADTFYQTDLVRFNATLRSRGMGTVIK